MKLRWRAGVAGSLLTALVLGFVGFSSPARADPAGPVTWGSTSFVFGGGWGRMIELTNGNWLCVSTYFPSGTNSRLRVFLSQNHCRTWTQIAQVIEAGRTFDNGELVQLPDGSLLLTGRSLIDGQSYKLPVYRSVNGGTNWTYLSNIDTSEGLGSRGLWEPDFWVLGDGRLVVTYSNEKHQVDTTAYSQIISERVSTDNGATWGSEIWAASQPGGGGQRPGMSQMVRMANGQYLLVYEVVGVGDANVYFKISGDGVSWSSGLGTHIPCQHCGPFAVSAHDGRLFVSSCENQISYSEDFGATWLKLAPPAWAVGHNFTWPALYQIQPLELGVMVAWGGVQVRFGDLFPRQVWPTVWTANFGAGTDPDWSRYGGNVAFVEGTYALNNTNTYGKSLTGDEFWSDGTLEADVHLATAGDAGLMFRATNPDYDGPDAAFSYYAGLSTGGFVFLSRMQNSYTELARANLTVVTNSWHHLKIIMSGNLLKVFVDDMTTPKITRTDTALTRGQMGVRSFQCNAQFDHVTFSNAVPPVLGFGLGLQGDYFGNPNLTNAVLSRIDPQVDFNWAAGSPGPGLGADYFSARWTGQVQAQFTETYTFYLARDNRARLWVGGQLLVDQWTTESNTVDSASLALVAGQKYDVRLEISEAAGNARAQFAWRSPSTPWTIIPPGQLYPPRFAPVTPSPAGALWRYFDRTNNLGTAWRSNSFSDVTWSNGLARLGFGGDGEVTQVASNQQWTTYCRRPFYVPDPTLIATLNARLTRDDGVAVYLNGAEVWRDNLPAGVLTHLTPAASAINGADETNWLNIALSPTHLIAGWNLLAAEIHQVTNTSSDLGFDLELTGTAACLAEPKLTILPAPGSAVLTWPASAGLFTLCFTDNLAPPVAWTPATNLPVWSNATWLVLLSGSPNRERFYRLQMQ